MKKNKKGFRRFKSENAISLEIISETRKGNSISFKEEELETAKFFDNTLEPTVILSKCKFGMNDCLYSGTTKCTGCVGRSNYSWDHTDRW